MNPRTPVPVRATRTTQPLRRSPRNLGRVVNVLNATPPPTVGREDLFHDLVLEEDHPLSPVCIFLNTLGRSVTSNSQDIQYIKQVCQKMEEFMEQNKNTSLQMKDITSHTKSTMWIRYFQRYVFIFDTF